MQFTKFDNGHPKRLLEGSTDSPRLVSLRFNHEHAGSGFIWRLFVGDFEIHVRHVIITSAVITEEVMVGNELKGNVKTYGILSVKDGVASISSPYDYHD